MMTYPTLTPYLTVRNAGEAMAFYKEAFDARERFKLTVPKSGMIGHAELEIRDSVLMISEENPEWGSHSPESIGGTPCKLCLLVENADAVYRKALEAGAKSIMEPADMFYGFRHSAVVDPFGHQWMIQHRIEDVDPAEMQRRWEKELGNANCGDNS